MIGMRLACAQATGLWAQLGAAKELVCEPRGTGKAFDGVMAAFYAAVRSGRGAIFFAICRGKVLCPTGACSMSPSDMHKGHAFSHTKPLRNLSSMSA